MFILASNFDGLATVIVCGLLFKLAVLGGPLLFVRKYPICGVAAGILYLAGWYDFSEFRDPHAPWYFVVLTNAPLVLAVLSLVLAGVCFVTQKAEAKAGDSQV